MMPRYRAGADTSRSVLSLTPRTPHTAAPGCSRRNCWWVSASIHAAPRGALDVVHAEVLGDHRAQRRHVDLKLGPPGGRSDRDVELVAHVARQVLRGGHELAAGRVVVDELVERVARLVRTGAEQAGDVLEVGAAVGLQADGERLVGAVDASTCTSEGSARSSAANTPRVSGRCAASAIAGSDPDDDRPIAVTLEQLLRAAAFRHGGAAPGRHRGVGYERRRY